MKLHWLLLLLIGVFACRSTPRTITPAFYYWKSNFNPTEFEKRKLHSLGVETVYVKLFDIAWDPQQQKALPVAKIFIRDTAHLNNKKIIPTVFITNEVFYNLDSVGVQVLAQNTASLIKKYLTGFSKKAAEIQMDCDWTNITKQKYFFFLQTIKTAFPQQMLSATIRLHQVKYTASSGIPPVNRGLLMCYNMGNLQDEKATNSIIDPVEFEKYRPYIKTYPLPLDVGLPLFSWHVLFRENKYAGLIQTLSTTALQRFKNIGTNRYEVMQDTIILGKALKAGDVLRYEESPINSLQKIAGSLSRQLTQQPINAVFYHCDSVILNKYNTYELEEIFGRLRHH